MDTGFNGIFLNNNEKNSLRYTYVTFMAFVELIIPRTPRLAEKYGEIQLLGALDLQTHVYLIITLNNYYIPLAKPIAEILDVLAEQIVFSEGNESLFDNARFLEGSMFSTLDSRKRYLVLDLLKKMKGYFSNSLIPEQHYPGVQYILNQLNRLTMLGYYSEWFGYGSTRLKEPDERKLEFFPASWAQVGYPGPSFSYLDLVEEYYMGRE